MNIVKSKTVRPNLRMRITRDLSRNRYVYLMAVPVIIYYLIFMYGPMYGAQIAFRHYTVQGGITGSRWVGLQYFEQFVSGPFFSRTLTNTLLISFYNIIFAFPAPIILALLLNELKSIKFKRTVQTIIYLPHFISLVVVAGLIRSFVARDGIITDLFVMLGMNRTDLLSIPGAFRSIYTISGIWQGVGWGTIIYLSAITAIDAELYEAAIVDGANRFQQARYITLPGLAPTITTLLILRVGQVMSVGYEKIILLYNPGIYQTADVISSYVYRVGLEASFQPSYSTAVNLFQSVVNFILVTLSNRVSKAINGYGLW